MVPVTVMCLAFVLWYLYWAVRLVVLARLLKEKSDEEAAGDQRNEMR